MAIPRGLLKGTPIKFENLRVGDVIDTYDFVNNDNSRFHRRKNQVVESLYSCDAETSYDLICRNLELTIQLISRR